jgi:DNA polymerase III epsilon subunit-like protein
MQGSLFDESEIETIHPKDARNKKLILPPEVLRPCGTTPLGEYRYLEGRSGSKELKSVCRLASKNKTPVCCDLETTGLNPQDSTIQLVAFTLDGKLAWVFNPDCVDIKPFKELLTTNPVINQSIKFDYRFWKYHWGIEANIFWDTQITYAMVMAGIS